MIRSPIQPIGPLGIDAPITGTTITAPLGAPFQAIDTFTNGAEVDWSAFTNTDQVIHGERGTLVYRSPQNAAGVLRANRVVGYVAPVDENNAFPYELPFTL